MLVFVLLGMKYLDSDKIQGGRNYHVEKSLKYHLVKALSINLTVYKSYRIISIQSFVDVLVFFFFLCKVTRIERKLQNYLT